MLCEGSGCNKQLSAGPEPSGQEARAAVERVAQKRAWVLLDGRNMCPSCSAVELVRTGKARRKETANEREPK